MLKKLTAVLLSALIVVLSVPAVRSSATDVTVEGTLGDVLYGYNSDDLLSVDNYLDYFTVPDDKLYLKFDAQYQRLTNNDSTEFGYTFWDNIKTYWDSNTDTGLKQIEFPNHTGYKLFYWWYTGNNFTCQTLVVDTQGTPVIINGRLACTEQFDLYYNQYLISSDFSSFSVYPNQSTYSGVVTGSQNGNYYYFNLDTNRQCMYSEIPYLMSYYSDNNYPDGSFLSQSPYDYDDFVNVLNAYYNNTDDTGFVIDRRTDKMINGGSSSSGGEIVSIDYDENLFEGVLGFNWFNPSATLNYNNHTQLYYPYFIFNYQINNYTNIHKTSCSIVVESSIGLCLRYNLDGSPYQTISHFSNNQTLLLTDNIDKFIIYGSDQGSNTWTNTSLRSTRGFGTATGLDPFEGDLTDDIKTALSQYGTNGNIDYAQSYALFKVNFYIKDNITGDISETYQAQFDLYNNKYSDNKEKLISNDNQEFIDFKNSFDYLQDGDDLTPVNYANDVSGGQGGSSIVTITNPQFPYLLVDIPEGEWMSKTPNLTTILTDFKDALSEVKDNSILNVMSETYNYLPVPVWQYFTYGVGILIAIGIWRAVTRR